MEVFRSVLLTHAPDLNALCTVLGPGFFMYRKSYHQCILVSLSQPSPFKRSHLHSLQFYTVFVPSSIEN